MNEHDKDRMKKLLQQALPPVDDGRGPPRDLWPAMLRRLELKRAQFRSADSAVWTGFNWAWFDGALAAGLVALVAFFPAAIPVLLYYL